MSKYLFPAHFISLNWGRQTGCDSPQPAPHCLLHLKEKHGSSGLSAQQSLNLLTGNIATSRSHTSRGPGRRWSHHFSKEAGQYLETLPLPLGDLFRTRVAGLFRGYISVLSVALQMEVTDLPFHFCLPWTALQVPLQPYRQAPRHLSHAPPSPSNQAHRPAS